MSVALDGNTQGVSPDRQQSRVVDPTRACLGIERYALRDLMADLYRPRQAIYWVDFLLSAMIGYTAFALLPVGDPWSFSGCLLY